MTTRRRTKRRNEPSPAPTEPVDYADQTEYETSRESDGEYERQDAAVIRPEVCRDAADGGVPVDQRAGALDPGNDPSDAIADAHESAGISTPLANIQQALDQLPRDVANSIKAEYGRVNAPAPVQMPYYCMSSAPTMESTPRAPVGRYGV